jgi:hypothetical protein
VGAPVDHSTYSVGTGRVDKVPDARPSERRLSADPPRVMRSIARPLNFHVRYHATSWSLSRIQGSWRRGFDPVRVSFCQCLACQRRTGSVFGAQARFPANSVTICGASKEFSRVGDAGSRALFNFCPTCGATVRGAVVPGSHCLSL